jgi:hypothetical protein
MNKGLIKIKWTLLRSRIYIENFRPSGFYIPIILFLIFTLILTNLYHMHLHNNVWSSMEAASGNALHFCEKNRLDQIIRQPSNTWSNLGFLLVGMVIMSVAIHDYKNKERKTASNFLVRYPIFSALYAVSCIYTFIGSFLYHASLTAKFQKLDQTGLYSALIMILIFNLYKTLPFIRRKDSWVSTHKWAVVLVVLINFAIMQWLYQININILFPALIILIAITSFYYINKVARHNFYFNYFMTAFIVLFAASFIWILDRQNIVCSPESPWQGHALWHILNAVSLLFIYMYYRSGTVPLVSEKEV